MRNASSDVLVHVGANLRRLRTHAGLSQQALAVRSGISRRTITAVEGGDANISLASLDHLAIAMGADFTELVKAPGAEPRDVDELVWRGREGASSARLLGTAPATTEGQLWLWSVAPGDVYRAEADPEGWHEMVHVSQGCLRLDLERERVLLAEGRFFVYPSNQVYSYACEGDRPVVFTRVTLL